MITSVIIALSTGCSNNPMYQQISKSVYFVSPPASCLVQESLNPATEVSKGTENYQVVNTPVPHMAVIQLHVKRVNSQG